MPELQTAALVVVCVLLTGTAVWYFGHVGRRQWRRARLISETPTTKASQLRPGFVEVQGRAATDMDLLKSPMTGQSCMHFHFVVTEQQTTRRGGKSKTKTVTIIDDVQTIACYVDDGSGRVAVDFGRADLHLQTDARARSGFLNEAPEELKRTLEQRYGRTTQGLIFNKSMTFRETVVCPGDPLYVIGTARRADAGFDAHFVIGRADGPGEGPRRGSVEDDLFIVSDHREDQVAARLRRSAYGNFAAAVAVAAVMVGSGFAYAFTALVHR